MAWREITHGGVRWAVAPVAERLANNQSWRLVLSYRGAAGRPVWANTGLIASSRSDLYAQADRMSDERLTAVLVAHLP
ncbi:MAG TPA: hypothetical protein VNJ71_01935 [Gemmatimonadales bacterium]|jgi:uncharacterized protein (DUF2126 family)|nr:hypothetical protein [Gemmatimonadales bacterium]